MPSADPWLPLDRFDDPSVPKLDNLKRASRAGFEVPTTRWSRAETLELGPPARPPEGWSCPPWIVRSGSPTEDTMVTSNAGQLLSVVVETVVTFAEGVSRVVEALPRSDGRPLGVVFVQPLITAETAGVTFFDGFYYEETWAVGSNEALTSGAERGQVRRGHVHRGEVQDAWLVRLHHLFGGRIDVEWAKPGHGNDDDHHHSHHHLEPVLLQVRPALFPIKRSETISLANHKEILGDPPSPWMVGLLMEVARPVMDFFEASDPEVANWDEPYAIEMGERAWMNFSAFFRLMDHWGLPRTMVTENVGGESSGPLDARIDFGRIARKLPTLLRKAMGDYIALFRIRRGFQALEVDLPEARTLVDLWDLNAKGLAFSIRTNFAINSLLAIASKVRRKLGLSQAAGRVVTHQMMSDHAELASRLNLDDRLSGLDAWLVTYGHRGPLESDPSQPRFVELRETLRLALHRGPADPWKPQGRPKSWLDAIGRFFFVYDEVREWFRDRLMRWWQKLRARILEEAQKAVDRGQLEAVVDVFFLRGDDLRADPQTWRARILARRQSWERSKTFNLSNTASKDAIAAEIQGAEAVLTTAADPSAPLDRFRGIGLGSVVVVGSAVKAVDLKGLLERPDLPESPILVASTLEPSWAVVFPRFAAVVVDLGGELSHASILLREAEIPAVVNARGAFRSINDGDRIIVDPVQGEVRIVGEKASLKTFDRPVAGL